MQFITEKNALIARRGGETLRIEGWGRDSLRVRAVMYDGWTGNDWALTETPEETTCEVQTGRDAEGMPCAQIRNGRLTATVNFAGVISFFRDGALILREYYRSYGGTISRGSRCLKIVNREWKGCIGGSEYQLTVRFDANDGEKIFGMGQYLFFARYIERAEGNEPEGQPD